MSRRAATLSAASVLVLVLALVGSLMPVPYVTLMPGPTRNTLAENAKGQSIITIDGRQTYATEGQLNFTTVTYRGGPGGRIDLLTALRGWIDGDTAVVPEETIFPEDESPEEVDQQNTRQMRDSQQDAEAAALHELGIPVSTRVVVDSVQKGQPADGKLEPDDEVTAVNGTAVTKVEQVSGVMDGVKPGDAVTLTVRRDGKEQRQEITTTKGPDGGAIVGVILAGDYKFPFEIGVNIGDIGGPSAGLIFSLAIIDKLTPGALTGGKFVAGTGTITPDGQVGPIGGIEQKMIAARRAGATVFLTPKDNCAAAAESRPDGLRLVRADTLKSARQSLDALTTGKGTVPSCTR